MEKSLNNFTFYNLFKPSVFPNNYVKSITFDPSGNEIGTTISALSGYFRFKITEDKDLQELTPIRDTSNAYSSCSLTADGNYLCLTTPKSSGVYVYEKKEGEFVKLSNSEILSGCPYAAYYHNCCYSRDGNYFAIRYDESPFISVFSHVSGKFTKLSLDAKALSGSAYPVALSPEGLYLAFPVTSTQLAIYKRNQSNEFEALTQLSHLGVLKKICFSPDGKFLAFITESAPFFYVYSIKNDSFVQQEVKGCNNTVYDCDFSYDNKYLAIAIDNADFLSIYKISGNTFSKIDTSNLIPSLFAQVFGCQFATNTNRLAIKCSNSPFIYAYEYTDDIFTPLIKINPPNLPPQSIKNQAFCPKFNHFIYIDDTDLIKGYKISGEDFIPFTPTTHKPASTINYICFSPKGSYFVALTNQPPYICFYTYNEDNYSFVPLSSVLNSNIPYAPTHCMFSKDERIFAVALSKGEGMCAYRLIDGIYQKIDIKEIEGDISGTGVAFTDSGELVLGHSTSDCLTLYSKPSPAHKITQLPTEKLVVGLALENGMTGEEKLAKILIP